MYGFLLKKEFREATALLIGLAGILFFVTTLSEVLISFILSYKFHFSISPYLWMIYVLLLFVAIGVIKGIDNAQNLKHDEKKKLAITFSFSILISFLSGWLLQVYWIVGDMQTFGSLYYLEQKWWIYYLPNFTIVLGFVFAGWKVRRKIHDL